MLLFGSGHKKQRQNGIKQTSKVAVKRVIPHRAQILANIFLSSAIKLIEAAS